MAPNNFTFTVLKGDGTIFTAKKNIRNCEEFVVMWEGNKGLDCVTYSECAVVSMLGHSWVRTDVVAKPKSEAELQLEQTIKLTQQDIEHKNRLIEQYEEKRAALEKKRLEG